MRNPARLRHLIFALGAWMAWQPASVLAAANSPPIRGISVELSWTDTRIEKYLDTGEEKPGYQHSTVQVYISDQGRFFSRFNRRARGPGNTSEKMAVSGEGDHILNWHFQGRTIAADQKFNGSGARHVVVSFDENVSSCSIQLIHGKEGNSPIRYPGLSSHRPIELIRIDVTNTTCQVRKGNIFAP
jgi:hypothetical protein